MLDFDSKYLIYNTSIELSRHLLHCQVYLLLTVTYSCLPVLVCQNANKAIHYNIQIFYASIMRHKCANFVSLGILCISDTECTATLITAVQSYQHRVWSTYHRISFALVLSAIVQYNYNCAELFQNTEISQIKNRIAKG